MKITLRYWHRAAADFSPDYNKGKIEKVFEGEDARACMRQIEHYRNFHDLVEYTIPEIVNVED